MAYFSPYLIQIGQMGELIVKQSTLVNCIGVGERGNKKI
jgi:hypothetical protein